jgi:uncharacterized DUF497 family protein
LNGDSSKAKDNYAKHGVSFELTEKVFKDPFAVEFLTTGKTMASNVL